MGVSPPFRHISRAKTPVPWAAAPGRRFRSGGNAGQVAGIVPHALRRRAPERVQTSVSSGYIDPLRRGSRGGPGRTTGDHHEQNRPDHGIRRLHRLPPGAGAARPGRPGDRPRRAHRLLRRVAEDRPPRHADAGSELHRGDRPDRDTGAVARSVRDAPARRGGASRRPGRGALFDRQPAVVSRDQHHRHLRAARGRPRVSAAAHAAGLDLLGLRRQHRDALPRDRPRRPPDVVLRREQEVDRKHGAQLRASLRPAGHHVPLLHRLRALGPAGHGAVQVHPRDPRGAADRGLQPRRHEARLHLCRRSRRGDPPADRRGARAARRRRGARG